MVWLAYRNKRGGFNIARKIEQQVGHLTAIYLQSISKKKIKWEDVMPFEFAKEKPKSQEDLFAQIIKGDYNS